MMLSSQLVHTVFAREIVVESARNGRYFFGLDSGMARFSKQKFCLCTSLRFRQLSNIFTKDYRAFDGGVHDRYFGKGDFRGNNLLQRYQESGFQNGGDVVKMVLVYFFC